MFIFGVYRMLLAQLTMLLTARFAAGFELLANWDAVIAQPTRHLSLSAEWRPEEASTIRDAAASWTRACPSTIHVWGPSNETLKLEPGDF